jgi:urease accessory protein
VAAGAALVAVFGLLHGHAHGTEMAGGALTYGAGMLLATAALHGVGLLLAAGAGDTRRLALRAAGGVASVAAAMVAIV